MAYLVKELLLPLHALLDVLHRLHIGIALEVAHRILKSPELHRPLLESSIRFQCHLQVFVHFDSLV